MAITRQVLLSPAKCRSAVDYWLFETRRAIAEAETRGVVRACLPVGDGERRCRVYAYAVELAHYGRLLLESVESCRLDGMEERECRRLSF